MRAAQSRQVVPHAEIAERNDIVRSRVELSNNRSDRRQALANNRERQGIFRNVSNDVQQPVADFELGHVFNEYRGTHTVSPRISVGVLADRFGSVLFSRADDCSFPNRSGLVATVLS